MATDVVDEELDAGPEEPQEEQSPKRRFRLTKKVKILLLLVLVMAVEAGGFLLLVPSGAGKTDEDDVDMADVETVEVEVETIRVTNTVAPGQNYSVSFKLAAKVAKDQDVDFRLAIKEHRLGVKQAAEIIAAKATLEDLGDPERALIRRQIKEQVNKVLEKSYVSEIMLTDFNYTQL